MPPNITAKPHDMFAINLLDGPGGQLQVQSVEITSPDLRQKLSFRQASGLREVFVADLANRLERILSRLADSSGVHTRPDLVITFPGLVLARLRILVNITPDGSRHVMLRFKYFIGGLQSAFRMQTHFTEPSLSHREKLAVDTLNEIATPLFNIANAAYGSDQVEDVQENLRRHLTRLAANAEELSFYLSLLSSYAAEAARTREKLAEIKSDPLSALR